MNVDVGLVLSFVSGTVTGVGIMWFAMRARTSPARKKPPKITPVGPPPTRVYDPTTYSAPYERRAVRPRREPEKEAEAKWEILPGFSLTSKITTAGAIALFLIAAVYKLLTIIPSGAAAGALRPNQQIPDINVTVNVTDGVRHRLDSAVVDVGDYRIARAPRQDIVEGLPGTWYEIDLRKANQEESLLFLPGQYEQREYESRFREVMARIQTEVLKPGLRYRLFVRGNADILADDQPFIDSLMNGRPVTVRFLKKKGANSNVYVNADSQQTIPVKYSNRDLPNLRGDYIRQRLQDQNSRAQVTLLDGNVTSQVSEADRNAQIFLFLPHTIGAH